MFLDFSLESIDFCSEVYPFADATFFCAATAKEAMVWLVQAGDAICFKHV